MFQYIKLTEYLSLAKEKIIQMSYLPLKSCSLPNTVIHCPCENIAGEDCKNPKFKIQNLDSLNVHITFAP